MKISKGLLPTPAVKDTKWKFSGTVENCTGTPTAAATGTPLSAGAMKLQVELPPGSTCSSLIPGAVVKGSGQVKWTAIDPVKNKPKTIFTDKFKTVVSFTRQGSSNPIVLNAVSPANRVDPKSKSLFQGKHYEFHFVIDETQAQIDAACPGPKNKGIQVLHFTGVQGTSTLTVAP